MSWLPRDESRPEDLSVRLYRCSAISRPRRWTIFSRQKLSWMALALMLMTASINAAAEDILGPIRKPILMPEASEFLQGFTVQLEVPAESLAGYIPVKITLKAVGRFPADRRFLFRFRSEPEFVSPPQNGLVVDVPVMVSQGAATETFIRYLPKWSAGQAVSVIVMEEGRALDGYDAFFGGENMRMPPRTRFQRTSRSNRAFLTGEYQMNWVFVSEEDQAVPEQLPDLSDLLHADETSFSNPLPSTGQRSSEFWKVAMTTSDLQAIGQRNLPTDWRAYQRFDAIVMTPEGLRRLQSNASAHQAIRGWVLNGGTLIVYNAASAPEVMDELGFTWSSSSNTKAEESLKSVLYELTNQWQQELNQTRMKVTEFESSVRLLQQKTSAALAAIGEENSLIEPAAPTEAEPVETGMFEAFQFNAAAINSLSATDAEFLDSMVKDAELELSRQRKRSSELTEKLSTSASAWVDQIQIQGVGAGYVIALHPVSERETPTAAHWRIIAAFLDHRASPTVRRGVDPLIGDKRFGRWTIPGVAQPPVYTFIGLLTAFVILVGPIAYRRTSKIGRSYLMFAIAPILALLTTVAMFGYGIVSDGFGTVVRVRQLTWVDGKSGSAGERVRSTYFAGVRPSDGLRFAGDAELMIYREGTGQSWEDLDDLRPGMLGQVTVEEGQQRLDAAFLPSRQQCQFVTHAPRNDVGYLELIPDPKGIESPEAVSGFAFPLRQAVVRDQQSKYWLIENLAPNSVQSTTPLSTRDASKLLGQLYNDHRPLSEVRETGLNSNRYNNEIYDVILDINRMLQSKVSIADGLFEFWLQQHLQTSGELPNQHFVAIADVSPDVIAVEGSELKSSIRYVFGTLR